MWPRISDSFLRLEIQRRAQVIPPASHPRNFGLLSTTWWLQSRPSMATRTNERIVMHSAAWWSNTRYTKIIKDLQRSTKSKEKTERIIEIKALQLQASYHHVLFPVPPSWRKWTYADWKLMLSPAFSGVAGSTFSSLDESSKADHWNASALKVEDPNAWFWNSELLNICKH